MAGSLAAASAAAPASPEQAGETGSCDPSAETCEAAAVAAVPSTARHRDYPWPQGRGQATSANGVDHFGQSPVKVGNWRYNFSAKLRWSWQHPDGRYNTIVVGMPVIDDEASVYLATLDGIRKFSVNGDVLWTWLVSNLSTGRHVPKHPAIADGLLYNCLTSGHVFALRMDTGALVWEVAASPLGIGGDTGFVSVRDGVVLLDVDPPEPMAGVRNRVLALNSSTGRSLWEYQPDDGVWNFLPLFPGDGTAVFQSWGSVAHRVNLSTGQALWSSRPSRPRGWTDGGPALGPNGIFYAVSSDDDMAHSWRSTGGGLHAYRVDDGKLLWEYDKFPEGIYSYPVVGHLSPPYADLSVVVAVGSLGFLPLQAQAFFCALFGAGVGLLLGFSWLCLGSRIEGSTSRRACMCCVRLLSMALGGAVVVTLFLWAFVLKAEYKSSVQAFNAETGQLRWKVDLPVYKWYAAAGDEAGFRTRQAQGVRPVCLPCASSYLTLDGQGVIHFGHLDGRLYRIKDWNNDGRIDRRTEISSFESGSAFGTGGPTIVPGMLAASSCDTLYVFDL